MNVDRLAILARDVEPPPLDDFAAHRMIERALVGAVLARPEPRRVAPWLIVPALAACAMIAWLVLHPVASSEPALSRVTLPTGDRLVTTNGALYDIEELVPSSRRFRVREGSMLFDVAKLVDDQRFIVVTPHTTVIARGTIFSVVTDTRATHVRVCEGVVEIDGSRFAAGTSWSSDGTPRSDSRLASAATDAVRERERAAGVSGAAASRGVSNGGGATSDGATSGGATSGGAPSGGAPSNGATSGGATSGGAPSGGATSGGAPSGGAPSGGVTSGGATSGGATSNGAGATSDGATSGGATSGGAPSGGATSGGAPSVGATSGGASGANGASGAAASRGASNGEGGATGGAASNVAASNGASAGGAASNGASGATGGAASNVAASNGASGAGGAASNGASGAGPKAPADSRADDRVVGVSASVSVSGTIQRPDPVKPRVDQSVEPPAVDKPGATDNAMTRATTHLVARRFTDALAIVRSEGKLTGEWKLVEGDALRGLGRMKEAASIFEDAAHLLGGPSRAEAAYSAAYLWFRDLHDGPKALSTLDTFKVDSPSSSLEERGLALRVQILVAAGKDATSEAQRYLDRFPTGNLRSYMQATIRRGNGSGSPSAK